MNGRQTTSVERRGRRRRIFSDPMRVAFNLDAALLEVLRLAVGSWKVSAHVTQAVQQYLEGGAIDTGPERFQQGSRGLVMRRMSLPRWMYAALIVAAGRQGASCLVRRAMVLYMARQLKRAA